MKETELQQLFAPVGIVKSVRLFREKNYGFVEFESEKAVDYILQHAVSIPCISTKKNIYENI